MLRAGGLAPAWSTVNVCELTVMVAVRGEGDVFAATE